MIQINADILIAPLKCLKCGGDLTVNDRRGNQLVVSMVNATCANCNLDYNIRMIKKG